MRARTTVASSSDSVRSGACSERWMATDLRPSPDLVAAVDVEDARLAQLGRPRLERRVDERRRLDLLGDDDRDVLPQRRERDHVVVEDALGNRRRQLVEIELEHAPRPLEQRRMELPEPACGGRRRLAGVEERAARRGSGRNSRCSVS